MILKLLGLNGVCNRVLLFRRSFINECNNNSFSVNGPSAVVSRIKIQPQISLELFWSEQMSLLIQTRTLSLWRKSYYGLWTRIINVLMLDLFLQMLTDGLECCGLLWCFKRIWHRYQHEECCLLCARDFKAQNEQSFMRSDFSEGLEQIGPALSLIRCQGNVPWTAHWWGDGTAPISRDPDWNQFKVSLFICHIINDTGYN